MGAKVVHFEILGKDAEMLHKFYGDLFDWEIKADNPMNYGIVTAQGKGGSEGEFPPRRRRARGTRRSMCG